MFLKIKSPPFLSTYRQRFIFFSMLFLLLLIYPSYALIKAFRYYIQKDEIQLVGIKYQEILGAIFYDSLKYEILLHEGDNAHLEELNQTIKENFGLLKKIEQEERLKDMFSLGYGFSSKKPIPLQSERLEYEWDKLEHLPAHEKIDALASLNRLMADKLERIGFYLSLFGNNYKVMFSLAFPTVSLLVEAQIVAKDRAISKNRTSLNLLMLQQELNEIGQFLQLKYEVALRDFRKENPEKDSLQAELQKRVIKYFDQLNQYNKQLDFSNITATLDLLEAGDQLRCTIFSAMEQVLEKQKQKLRLNFHIFILSLFLSVSVVFGCLIFKPLTQHLKKLKEHINSLAQGNLASCFCSPNRDEFGLMGKTFDAICSSVSKVSHELESLSKKLAEATKYVGQTARDQAFTVNGEELQIKEIEEIVQRISSQQREMIAKTEDYQQKGPSSFSINKAKMLLSSMQLKMTEFMESSRQIVRSIKDIEDKIKGMDRMIEFVEKVSESVNLLSLNASIETANILTRKESFEGISQKIQRFAENTAQAAKDTRQIIEGISIPMRAIKKNSLDCIEEINLGAQQLIGVGNQLSKIAKQGNEEKEKFEKFKTIIDSQIKMMGNVAQSIIHLRESGQSTTLMTNHLYESLAELGFAAVQLQKTLNLFGVPSSYDER
jgi:methyl-accepting chemotaxis protein